MELPLPWTEERFDTDPILKPIHDLFHDLYAQGIHIAPMGIARDRDYSTPELARVVYYRRPAGPFAKFEPEEYLLPAEQIAPLVRVLLLEPESKSQFDPYRQPPSAIREIMICTHGNVDVACARFGQPLYQILKKEYAAANSSLRVWRCSHFGGHQFAPTLVDFPTGQVWGHLEPQILPTLIDRHRPVAELRPFYRGWSGLGKFEQMVEREVWMQRGWDWLTYEKAGEVIEQRSGQGEGLDRVTVRLEFVTPSGVKGCYEAIVRTCGNVTTAVNSGGPLKMVDQYEVTELNQVH